MNSLLNDITLSMMVNIISGALSLLGLYAIKSIFSRKTRASKIWGRKLSIREFVSKTRNKTISIIIATGSRKKVSDGWRPQTGIGQVVAVAAVFPSISVAYKKPADYMQVFLSQNCYPVELSQRGDLVVIGGPKTNIVCRDFLKMMSLPAGTGIETKRELSSGKESLGDVILWKGQEKVSNNLISPDICYGLIIRRSNPRYPKNTLTLLMGSGTYGTEASAIALVEQPKNFSPINYRTLDLPVNGGPISLVRRVLLRFKKTSLRFNALFERKTGYIALVQGQKFRGTRDDLNFVSNCQIVDVQEILW